MTRRSWRIKIQEPATTSVHEFRRKILASALALFANCEQPPHVVDHICLWFRVPRACNCQDLFTFVCKFPRKTTSTAQYLPILTSENFRLHQVGMTYVAPPKNISCLFTEVSSESTPRNAYTKSNTVTTIIFADMLTKVSSHTGTIRRTTAMKATSILMNVPSLLSEWCRISRSEVFLRCSFGCKNWL
jgi:hypothetical protein